MARLTNVYRTEEMRYVNIGRRQLPVSAGDDNLMMLMDLSSKGLSIDSIQIKGKELEEFTRKFNLLAPDELRQSLEIDGNTLISVLNQCVQCVGCRRRVERLFYQLTLSGHPTLDPLVLKNSCILTVSEEKMKSPVALGTLLYRHHDILNNLLDSKLRNKTRCVLHSLDAFRSKPFSETWREVWSSMKQNCRDELAVIETKELHEVMDNYLKKHKFCTGCRTKIEKAYKILVGEIRTKEKGFVGALYANIKKCPHEKHIHILTNKIDFLDALIRRAEPEVNGSYSKLRERHAKTLEIAQEEVLTCVGMIMYERLRRAYVSLREEERACQLLAAVGVHSLCRSFDMCVEKKQGISNLELLYQEISRAEKAREHKREQKKLKKKKKKNEKKNSHHTGCLQSGNGAESGEVQEEEEENHVTHDKETNEHDDEDDDDDDDDKDNDNDNAIITEVENDRNDNSNGTIRVTKDGDGDKERHQKPKLIDGKDKNKEEQEEGKDEDMECCQLSNAEDNRVVCTEAAAGSSVEQKKKKKKKQKSKQKPTTTKPVATKNVMITVNMNNNNSSSSNNNDNNNNNKTTAEPTNNNNQGRSLKVPPTNIKATTIAIKCNECDSPCSNCPCDVKDSGYGSEPLSHRNSRTSSVICTPEDSPESSEISCQEGFCNHKKKASDTADAKVEVEEEQEQDEEETDEQDTHDGQNINDSGATDNCLKLFMQQQPHHVNMFSLQQMLDDFVSDDEDKDNCYIPQEVVMEYQCQREKVQQQRLQLRENLRHKFALLCKQQQQQQQQQQQAINAPPGNVTKQ